MQLSPFLQKPADVAEQLNRNPAEMAQSNYFARVDEKACTGCETCFDRCQIEAVDVIDGISTIDLNR